MEHGDVRAQLIAHLSLLAQACCPATRRGVVSNLNTLSNEGWKDYIAGRRLQRVLHRKMSLFFDVVTSRGEPASWQAKEAVLIGEIPRLGLRIQVRNVGFCSGHSGSNLAAMKSDTNR